MLGEVVMNEEPEKEPEKEPETFWQMVWRISKRPIGAFRSNLMAQSLSAFGLNLWCLVLAVLGQFWVFLSALLLLAQSYNTWLVFNGRMSKLTALAIGLVIVLLNIGALMLAVLGQFWVFVSTGLAIWQFVVLVRVCASKPSLNP